MHARWLLLLVLTCAEAADVEPRARPRHVPRVVTQQGPVVGKTMTSHKGIWFYGFQGIPYAAPPVGELRFKPPQEAKPWSLDRLAIYQGSDCIQKHVLFSWAVGAEDCLYLNVYTPTLDREGDGLSVMVWIHGGGFHSSSGSPEFYGPEFFLDHKIVLVTINYRLGPLGFLSLGTPEAPGNYGLKDQVAALRWVQNNIAKFGGNPDSVTIFGESAGGASIHYLMLSPLARGLFHRAIAQSGSAHNRWAFERNPAKLAEETAAAVGCKQPNKSGDVMKCLQGLDAQRFIKIDQAFQIGRKKKTIFVPSIEPAEAEGAFLTEDPRAMLARGDIADVPLMAGLMTHEGMLELMVLRNRSVGQVHMDNYRNLVPEELGLPMVKDSPEWNAVWQRVDRFYQKASKSNFLEHFFLLTSDVDFVLGVDELVRGVAALRRSPVYYYQFSYDGGLGFLKRLADLTYPGSTAHTDELGYMFTKSIYTQILLLSATKTDQMTIDRVTKLWTDFAKTGNPTPDKSLGVKWKPVDAPLHDPKMADTSYLDIGKQLVMKEGNLNAARIEFWQNLRDNPFESIKSDYQTYFKTYPNIF